MSEELEEVKEVSKSSRNETILAKAKAATMIIGAVATACTAVWGAVRQPPEPGAKIVYGVLKEALQYERDRREKLEEEIDSLKPKIESCAEFEKKIENEIRQLNLINKKSSRSPASAAIGSEVSNESKSNEQLPKNRSRRPELPPSKELGL